MKTAWFKSVGSHTAEVSAKEAAQLMSACDLRVNPRYSDVGAGYAQYDSREFPSVRLVLRTVWWR